MIGNTYLELKRLKNPLQKLCLYNNKVTNKVNNRLPKPTSKEFYFTLL